MIDKSANKQKPQKRKAPKSAWKKGQSGNPAGAPKRGESWAELFNSIGDLTTDEVIEKAQYFANQFKRLPKQVTLKTLVVIRAYAALLDESNARLLKEVMDRAEGKVADVVKGTGEGGAIPVKIVEVVKTYEKQ